MKLLPILLLLSMVVSELHAKDDDVYYRSVDGGRLWFENVSDPDKMILCSGHTCASYDWRPLVCDDQNFYCLNDFAIKISIPKDLVDRLPITVTKDIGQENSWDHNGMRHKAWPWGRGRVSPNSDTYFQEAKIWGSTARVIGISSYEPNSDRPFTMVVYSPEWGILAVEGTYAGSDGSLVYESYVAEGRCGYLATHADCK